MINETADERDHGLVERERQLEPLFRESKSLIKAATPQVCKAQLLRLVEQAIVLGVDPSIVPKLALLTGIPVGDYTPGENESNIRPILERAVNVLRGGEQK